MQYLHSTPRTLTRLLGFVGNAPKTMKSTKSLGHSKHKISGRKIQENCKSSKFIITKKVHQQPDIFRTKQNLTNCDKPETKLHFLVDLHRVVILMMIIFSNTEWSRRKFQNVPRMTIVHGFMRKNGSTFYYSICSLVNSTSLLTFLDRKLFSRSIQCH